MADNLEEFAEYLSPEYQSMNSDYLAGILKRLRRKEANMNRNRFVHQN